jgi:hypothetical protein
MVKEEFDELFPPEPEPIEFQPYQSRLDRAQAEKKKNGSKFLERVVTAMLIAAFAFIVTVIYFNWTGRMVQDSLIYTGLAAILGELTLASSITRKEKELELAQIQNGHGQPEPHQNTEVL